MTLPAGLDQTRAFRWRADDAFVTVGVDELGEGPPLLMLPALSSVSTREELKPLALKLADRFRVIVPDWPGFGDAASPPVRWEPRHLQAFLMEFVAERLATPVPVLAAGHAAGYALDLAARQPGTFSRLALVAPTWRGPLPTMVSGHRPWQAAVRRLVQAPLVGPLAYRLNVNRPVVRMMLRGHVLARPASLTPERLAAKLKVTRRGQARFASAAFVTGGLDLVQSREAFHDLVRRTGAPVLVIWGPQTPPRSRAEIEVMAALPGVAAARLSEGALGVHEEHADQVAAAVRDFLAAG